MYGTYCHEKLANNLIKKVLTEFSVLSPSTWYNCPSSLPPDLVSVSTSIFSISPPPPSAPSHPTLQSVCTGSRPFMR